MLTGTALKETVDALTAQGKTRSEIAIACGYCTVEGNNTKIHFTDFYMALLEAKNALLDDIEEETIEAEDPDNQEAINAALENYSAEAVAAFIELYGEENVEHFEDALIGVNNRDLKTFEVDLGNSVRLRNLFKQKNIFIAESGIQSREDIDYLKLNNIKVFLIGESLMRGSF